MPWVAADRPRRSPLSQPFPLASFITAESHVAVYCPMDRLDTHHLSPAFSHCASVARPRPPPAIAIASFHVYCRHRLIVAVEIGFVRVRRRVAGSSLRKALYCALVTSVRSIQKASR